MSMRAVHPEPWITWIDQLRNDASEILKFFKIYLNNHQPFHLVSISPGANFLSKWKISQGFRLPENQVFQRSLVKIIEGMSASVIRREYLVRNSWFFGLGFQIHNHF